jgi:predicted DNA-binding transcriptional regulator AlpA
MPQSNPTTQITDPYLLLPEHLRSKAFINSNDFMQLLDMARAAFFEQLKSGKLPPPSQVHARNHRWAVVVVAEYIRSLITDTNTNPTKD